MRQNDYRTEATLQKEGIPMIVQSTPQTEADIPRVDLGSESSIQYWCTRWKVGPADLKAAVARAGSNQAPAVAFALDREAW
jgi:Protein of unknown function (DUF3606)